ncbi:MAG: hypothetical protein ACT4QC_15430 [Planctomycetaceae bacterium]
MELQDALLQVSEIRRRIARAETFRGYRAIPAAASSVVACVTAAIQPVILPEPARDPLGYVALWVAAAVVSVVVLGSEMLLRLRRSESSLTRQMMFETAEQFLPCVIAGAAVTLVLSWRATEQLWLLPGLWGVLFSLGVFACCRLLPRPLLGVAIYYLVCGLGVLSVARGAEAFSPWVMAVTFGGGQLLTAVILYCTVERQHDSA